MSDVIQASTIEPVTAPAPDPAPIPDPAPAPAPLMPVTASAPAPVVAPDGPAEVGYGETVQIGTITANSGTDPLSIVFLGAPSVGTLSLDGNGDILYTAPTNVTAGEIDSFTYEIENAAGAFSAPVTTAITLDPGPAATDPNLVVGHGGQLDLSTLVSELASPGLSGDTLTVTAASAANGTIMQSKTGDWIYQAAGNGGSSSTTGYDITTASDAGSTKSTTTGSPTTTGWDITTTTKGTTGTGGSPAGNDVITYTVTDQLGDSVTGSAAVTIDPGPVATDPNLVVGHGGQIDLSSIVNQLATPGLSGDTLTVTAVSAANGTIVQSKTGDWLYQAAGTGGPDTKGYDITTAGDAGSTATTTTGSPTTTGWDTTSASTTGSTASTTTGSPTTTGWDITTTKSTTGSTTGSGGSAGSDVITYTVTDQLGDSVTGTATVTLDSGPVATDPNLVVGHGGQLDLSSIVNQLATPGLSGDTLTVTAVSAANGTILQTKAGDFVYEAIGNGNAGGGPSTTGYDLTNAGTTSGYDLGAGGTIVSTGSSTALTSGTDTITYTVTDQAGDSVTGTANVTIDPGPTLAAGTTVIAPDHTVDLTRTIASLITPGLTGDTETVTAVSTQTGEVVLQYGSTGGYDIKYTAPATGNDTLTYTVTDSNGDTATGNLSIAVDPGPILAQGSMTIGHGQSTNLLSYLESLITPGVAGDSETITSVQATFGTAALEETNPGVGTGKEAAVYTAPASGNDVVTYMVEDQNGVTATGTVAITVDSGPMAGNLSTGVQVGQSIDLTQQILGTDIPGLAGDALTLVGDNTQGTAGNVSLVNGDLVYTASHAAFASLGAGATTTDNFAYTVSDQYGDQATGTVTLDVSNPVTTINGNTNGGATIEGTGGNQTINAFGWGNTIDANGGNGTINAGQGQATVNAGSGNVTVNLNGYNNVVTGGDGTDSVSGSLGSTSVMLGNGNDTVNLGGYGNAITVGNGNDTIVAGAGSDTVTGGSGTDNVTLAGYSDSVSFTGGNDTISGGAGSDVFDLTGGSASLALNGYSNMVFLHSTNATIADTAQGTMIDIYGGGTDVIQDAASDQSLVVDLKGGLDGYTSAASVVAALTSDGHGGALLSFGASNGSVDFAGVAPSALHASNFQIG